MFITDSPQWLKFHFQDGALCLNCANALLQADITWNICLGFPLRHRQLPFNPNPHYCACSPFLTRFNASGPLSAVTTLNGWISWQIRCTANWRSSKLGSAAEACCSHCLLHIWFMFCYSNNDPDQPAKDGYPQRPKNWWTSTPSFFMYNKTYYEYLEFW